MANGQEIAQLTLGKAMIPGRPAWQHFQASQFYSAEQNEGAQVGGWFFAGASLFGEAAMLYGLYLAAGNEKLALGITAYAIARIVYGTVEHAFHNQ